MGLVVLEDDRRYFPPYEAAFVIRRTIADDPPARRALERLSGAISAEAMRRMNAAVDRDRRSPGTLLASFWRRLFRPLTNAASEIFCYPEFR